jgi:type IX secretion system PorP/SprF family membrane protein
MTHWKIYLLGVGVILTTGWSLDAQQLSHYTQFMFNDYVLNPAVAGTKDYYQVRSVSRFQWTGIVDAPQTISLSAYGPHKSLDMGFGGYLFSDVTGPTSKTGIYGTYAYNLEAWNDIRLSMGVSLGILQSKFDGTEIRMFQDDPLVQGGVYNAYSPDAALGLYLYHENWYAGFSAFQLFANKLKLYDVKSGLNKLKNHFFLVGGYRYDINDEFSVEPSIIIKGVTPVPMQVDLNARATYLNRFWLGLSYRTKDAFSFLLGYIHEERFYFGYAFDISTSTIKDFNSGTHEIMIGIRLNPVK